jgi:hypothetical protein
VFAKVVALIVALALCACALLAARQMRLQAAHELAGARLRASQRENDLWRLRARIASRLTPEHISEMAARLGQLRPIALDAPAAPIAAAGPMAGSREATGRVRP